MPLTDTQVARFTADVQAISVKDTFRRTAAKVLRDTPEYAQAKAQGHGTAWLKQESESAAEMLWASLVARLDSLDPYNG